MLILGLFANLVAKRPRVLQINLVTIKGLRIAKLLILVHSNVVHYTDKDAEIEA